MTARRRALVILGAAVAAAALLAVRQGAVDDPLERLACAPGPAGPAGGSIVCRGTWHFPRSGPYVLGFESPGAASLSIDGREVARGAGQKAERVVFAAGARAVAFSAPAGARLLWHPPGRRGPLEYVPPSSLDPGPPGQAEPGAWVGASPLDGLFALALAAIGAGTAVWLILSLWPGALRGLDRRTLAATGAVLALAAAVRLVDLGGAGQTWDEDVYWSAGRNDVTNWLSLDFRPSSWRANFEHPPVTKLVAGIAAQWADGYGPARAASALLVAAACGLLVLVGRRLFSLRVGLLAGVVAALSPHLVAHGKVVGHEAVAIFLWTAALLAALAAHDGLAGEERGPAATRRLALRLAAVGALLGLAVFSRFVNILAAPLLGAVLLSGAPAGWRRRTLVLGAAILPVVALAVGLALWPRLWSSPVQHLAEAWGVLRGLHGEEPFLGQITNRPPALLYFPAYLFATAPLGVLVGLALWLARAAARRERGSLVVALWLLIPLLVAFSPVRQDGVRYVVPALVAMALACAAGVDWLVSWLGQKTGRGERPTFLVAAGALALYLAVVCLRIHPYYLDYYGEQVGGPAGVERARRFEVGWWGEGIHDAVAYVNRHAGPGARVHRGCVRPSHLTWLRGDLWTDVRRPAAADWILVYEPWRRCPLPPDARLVHEVSAQGAPIARVYARGDAAAAGDGK